MTEPTGAEVLSSRTRMLFVGANPPPAAMAIGAPFSAPSNRFFPALLAAGIVDRRINTADGLDPEDRRLLDERGISITALVARATPGIDGLTAAELVGGVEGMRRKVRELRPDVVAFLGISTYRIAFRSPRAVVGHQPEPFEGAQLWVVPNPSGRNRSSTLVEIAAAYREAAIAAGLELQDAPGTTSLST